ncbi:hypothetical protein V1522DRAFT_417302 [Lipomyces starkeyi]
MKKILKHSRSKSPSDSDATNTANPYAEDSSNLSGPAYNPYALGSNSYNSVPSYYSRNSPSPRTGTPLAGATSVIRPVTGVNNVSPARNNPYDVSSFSSPSSSSSSRRILTRPPAPVTDLTGTTPYINPYGNTSSTSTNLQRQELLGRPAIVSNENVAAQTYDYDPSIMETEAEREARHAGEEILRQGQEYLFSEQSLYVQIQEQEQEEEDLEVNALKEQIRHTNKQSLTSADNALRYAEEAEASGLRTLQALGEQGDQLGSAENSVAVTENQTKLAEDYASELKSLNRSMFAVHVSNPFNSRRRLMEQEDKIRNTFRAQQIDKETNRRRQYESQQRVASAMGNVPGDRRRQLTETERKYREQMNANKAKLAETSKYLFEPDEEDFENERELESRLDGIGSAATRLNMMAKSISTEVTAQNERLSRLSRRTEDVEVGVHLNTVRLARIVR